MHTFKLGVMGFAIAFEFSGTPQVCARPPATASPLASNQHRQRYLRWREASRLK
jgi:hypothetical protein